MIKLKDNYRNKTIQKLDKSTLDQGLKVQGFHLPFPWQVFSSLQVADAFGVSLTTMHNMRMRRKGPPSEPFEHYRGNRLLYRYDRLCEWLTGLPAWKFHQDWIAANHSAYPHGTKQECFDTSTMLIGLGVYRQPKWRRKYKFGSIRAIGGCDE